MAVSDSVKQAHIRIRPHAIFRVFWTHRREVSEEMQFIP
jgi:hypothetical protein